MWNESLWSHGVVLESLQLVELPKVKLLFIVRLQVGAQATAGQLHTSYPPMHSTRNTAAQQRVLGTHRYWIWLRHRYATLDPVALGNSTPEPAGLNGNHTGEMSVWNVKSDGGHFWTYP